MNLTLIVLKKFQLEVAILVYKLVVNHSIENKGETNIFIINYDSNSNNSSMYDRDDEIV